MKRVMSSVLAVVMLFSFTTFCAVAEGAEAFTARVTNGYYNIYAESYETEIEKIGADSTSLRSFEAFAWRGDETFARVDLFTREQGYEDVALVKGDLVNGTGDVISADNITFTYMDAAPTYGYGRNGEGLYEVITDDTLRDLKEESLYCAWVTIVVPEAAKAGVYTTTLSAVCGDTVLAEFLFTVRVYDLVQPALNSVVDLWMWPYNSVRYYSGLTTEEFFGTDTARTEVDYDLIWNTHLDEKYFPALESELELYAKAGGDAIFAQIDEQGRTNGDPYPSLVKWTKKADGTFSFDYTDFDKWVELNMKHGIDSQIKCYDLGQWQNRIVYYDEAKGEVVNEMYYTKDEGWRYYTGIFIDDFMVHLKEKGWFDITYIAMDEKDYYITKAVVDLVKAHTDADGDRLKLATAVACFDCESLFDDIDDLSLAYGLMSGYLADIVERRNELGLITTLYTCGPQGSSMIDNPYESAQSVHQTYKLGCSGFLRWALQKYNADPYESSINYNESLCAGDCYLIYPSRDINEMKSYSTPRYEALCEGIRDVAKAEYLEEHLTEIAAQVNGAFMATGHADAFRAVIDKYSAVLEEAAYPAFDTVEAEYTLEIGDSVTVHLTEESYDVIENQVVVDYIDDSVFSSFLGNGWYGEGQYHDLFLYSTNHYVYKYDEESHRKVGYTFSFTGDGVQLWGNRGPQYAYASVTIDGRMVGMIDAYGSVGEKFALLFEYDGLEYGEHFVEVRGLGRRNPAAYAYYMQVDYATAKTSVPVEWSVGDSDVATVDEEGTVTAVGTGTTTLTVKCGAVSATVIVTVKCDGSDDSHVYDKLISVVAPACDVDGYTLYECGCGAATRVYEEGSATGHSHEWHVTTLPTVGEMGVNTGICHCGDTITEFIPALTAGECNGDGMVNIIDLTITARYLAQRGTEGVYDLSQCNPLAMDANADGSVDQIDLNVIANIILLQ